MTTYEKTLDKMEDYANGTLLLWEISDSDLANILVALDKQIPKKPYIQQIEINGYNENCFECPSCDSFIGYVSDCEDEHYQITYCSGCGQRLNWE